MSSMFRRFGKVAKVASRFSESQNRYLVSMSSSRHAFRFFQICYTGRCIHQIWTFHEGSTTLRISWETEIFFSQVYHAKNIGVILKTGHQSKSKSSQTCPGTVSSRTELQLIVPGRARTGAARTFQASGRREQDH